MTVVSLVEFRKNASRILGQVRRGQSLLLTVRGKPVARIEPVRQDISTNDPLYLLAERAVQDDPALSNAEMDRLIYET
ncbi:MAG: type II toxin-antitoxin system prevent-host-death family antitoxin [Kiritimatiellia bacterium]|nr:type II toxin-antitoxin system prevent-host-death family antitoxin [Kiritimatiellia bacterium]